MFKKIIIFSCPRTGSTLLYNLIKDIFYRTTVLKKHIIDDIDSENLYIIPIRHPYNSIVSIGLCKQIKFGIDNYKLNDCLNDYIDYGGKILVNIENSDNIIFLYYENFYNNLDYIYKEIEKKLNVTIPEDLKKSVGEKHSLENVKKIICSIDNFELYEKETNYHGFHISKFNGETDYKLILSEQEILFLETNDILNRIITKFNYNQKYDLTVIQVFKEYSKKETRIDDKYDYHGIGDLLRGTNCLYKLSKELNFNLIIDIRHHKVSSYIQSNLNPYMKLIDNEVNNIPFIFKFKTLKNYIDSNKDKKIVYVTTNSIYNDEINVIKKFDPNYLSSNEKEFMTNFFIPKGKLKINLEQTFSRLLNFKIIHFRLNDCYNFIKYDNETNIIVNDIFSELEKIFIKNYEKDDILLTNNLLFKKYLKSKYDCNTFDTVVHHLGIIEENNVDKIVYDNLFEFFIQSKATVIKTYSDYNWISGFVYWISIVNNINLINIKDNIDKNLIESIENKIQKIENYNTNINEEIVLKKNNEIMRKKLLQKKVYYKMVLKNYLNKKMVFKNNINYKMIIKGI